ncbi:Leucine-rich repeat receptor-like protein kinase [Hibiscus syriacus]|uniref:Leucine-rich repeat receptor-like protein kinase n=1 Tax=Hibiscus syriacus TaxID=106335 RepID=A0A6A2XBK8_HIBSY|nr:uncharacterized protein LOC120171850 [Hibiscus syriacus]KAE8672618.1 Leucine-rich repeat receptor-like protein kinase [Hibiscus syriacus]
MGICTSCDSTHVATAKLILHDGRLQEFPYLVKASYVLQKNPMCFICNADEMAFDDVVAAIEEDEELHPGQLYFALPLTWLNRPLHAEEMAALAVKASSALMKTTTASEKCRCRSRTVTPFSFSEESPRRKVSPAGVSGGGNGGEKRGRGRRGSRKFKAVLSSIPE